MIPLIRRRPVAAFPAGRAPGRRVPGRRVLGRRALGVVVGAALLVPLSGCRLVADPSLRQLYGGLARPTTTTEPVVERDVAYGTDLGCEDRSDLYCGGSQELDVHRATGGSDTGRRPVLVWVHGGGWAFGDKSDDLPVNLRRQLARGYDVVAVNYRLAPMVDFPTPLLDVKLALRWVRANASDQGWDPRRIIVGGHSAGGNLAAMVATTVGVRALEPRGSGDTAGTRTEVAAAVSLNGVLDLRDAAGQDLAGRAYVELYTGCVGCDRAGRASVAGWVTPGAAPLYLVHGALDGIARPLQGISVCLQYQRVQRPCAIDIVDTGPPVVQGHDASHGLNQVALERFLDAARD